MGGVLHPGGLQIFGNFQAPGGEGGGQMIHAAQMSSPTAGALYNSPNGSLAPGSLYAEVTDYQSYHTVPQIGLYKHYLF